MSYSIHRHGANQTARNCDECTHLHLTSGKNANGVPRHRNPGEKFYCYCDYPASHIVISHKHAGGSSPCYCDDPTHPCVGDPEDHLPQVPTQLSNIDEMIVSFNKLLAEFKRESELLRETIKKEQGVKENTTSTWNVTCGDLTIIMPRSAIGNLTLKALQNLNDTIGYKIAALEDKKDITLADKVALSNLRANQEVVRNKIQE